MAYLNVTEVESALRGLTTAYPSMCELITLPLKTATDSLTCYALRIGVSGGILRNGVLFMGCAHGDEWGGTDICVDFAATLLKAFANQAGVQYGNKSFSAAEVSDVLNRLDLFLFPLVNPEGRSRTQRKNGQGVDLNRNYDYLWDVKAKFSPFVSAPVGSTNPGSTYYHGTSPGSEREVQNVAWLLQSYPNIRRVMDIHSALDSPGLVLFSWSDDETQSIDPVMSFKEPSWDGQRGVVGDMYKEYAPTSHLQITKEVAEQVRDAINAVRGKSWLAGEGVSFYESGVSGTATDFAYSRRFLSPQSRTIFGFGLEFPGPIPPWTEMQAIIVDVSAGLFEFCLHAIIPLYILTQYVQDLRFDPDFIKLIHNYIPPPLPPPPPPPPLLERWFILVSTLFLAALSAAVGFAEPATAAAIARGLVVAFILIALIGLFLRWSRRTLWEPPASGSPGESLRNIS